MAVSVAEQVAVAKLTVVADQNGGVGAVDVAAKRAVKLTEAVTLDMHKSRALPPHLRPVSAKSKAAAKAEAAAKELNPGEYTQGRIRVVPVEMPEDYDVYPVTERTSV